MCRCGERAFREVWPLELKQLLTSLFVSSFQQFRGSWAACTCAVTVVCMSFCLVLGVLFGGAGHFSGGGGRFWISVGGVVYDLVWCLFCPLWPGWSRVSSFLPRGSSVPTCGGLRGSALELLHLQVVFTAFLAWAITRVRFSLCILYIYLIYFVHYLGVDFY